METPPNYLIEIRVTTDATLARLVGLLCDTSDPFPERERVETPEEVVAPMPAERVYWITCRGIGDIDHPPFRHVPGLRCVACDAAQREAAAANIDPVAESIQEAIEADRQAEEARERLLADEMLDALTGEEPATPDELSRVVAETIAPVPQQVAKAKAKRPTVPPLSKRANIHPAADPATPKLPKAPKRRERSTDGIPEGWLQPSSYAAKYKVKLQTLYGHVKAGKVESVKVRGSIYIKPRE